MGDRVKPTFTIVESEDTFDYDGFAKDYQENILSKDELKEKYDLNDSGYFKKTKYAKQVTGYTRPRGNKDENMAYIDVKNNKFLINKVINGERRYCGTYADLKTAQMVRNILVEYDWSEDMIKKCRKIYSTSKSLKKGANQYTNSHISREALNRFDEFRELFESNKYTGVEIEKKMGFTKRQYDICREKMKQINPARKPLVRHI